MGIGEVADCYFVRMNLQRLRYAYLDGVHWAVFGPGEIASVIPYCILIVVRETARLGRTI